MTLIDDRALVNFSSKKQPTVSLSSCESEVQAGAALAQDILFVNGLIEEITGQQCTYPSIMRGDNQGAVFVLNNNSIGPRTKHVDIRVRFVTDLVKKKKIRLEWINTESNYADINSKNLKDLLHTKFAYDIFNGLFFYSVIAEDDHQYQSHHSKNNLNPKRYRHKLPVTSISPASGTRLSASVGFFMPLEAGIDRQSSTLPLPWW